MKKILIIYGITLLQDQKSFFNSDYKFSENKLLEYRKDTLVETNDENEYSYKKTKKAVDFVDIKRFPKVPDWFKPREYQIEAIDSWKNNNFKGLLSMATGTGKTLTALYGFTELWKKTERLVTIIICPQQYLVEQWAEDVRKFNIIPTLCYSNYPNWREKIFNAKLYKKNYS